MKTPIKMDQRKGEIVVLTGAAGCLGYHTLRLLIGRDESVEEIRCLDLREPEELMKKGLEEAIIEQGRKNEGGKKKSIKWIQGDIRDINVVERTLEGADCVIHCAAKIDVWSDTCDQDEPELESVNVGGTETLLQASIRLGVQKFIHVSSFEVYTGYDTLYYATEATLPDPKWLLFGPSGWTKRVAENKVKQYSNSKLSRAANNGKDSLNAIIVRFPTFYGEFEKYFVSRIMEVTKFLGGTLRRLDNIWIKQQPIYVENAAWSLISAKKRMDKDQSISGEEFHVTDETTIGDPFDFVEPYLETRGMRVTKSAYPFIPLWLLLFIIFALRKYLKQFDFFGLFTSKRDRLQEAIERDQLKPTCDFSNTKPKRWYHYITPQTFGYMGSTNFLNRTKASLRLDYDPIIKPEDAHEKSLNWYRNHPIL